MEQYKKIMSELSKYGHCIITPEANGELIIRLIPHSNVVLQACEDTVQNEAEQTNTGPYAYFTKISKSDRDKVAEWLKGREGTRNREKDFLQIVKEAIEKIDYEYWIATMEPSIKDGEIYYEKHQKVGVGTNVGQLKKMAKRYSTESGSRMATLHELFLWYALRIVNSLWTFEFVTINSSGGGNYCNAPGASHQRDKTGEKICGGYRDGQGNTCKIVTIEDGYALTGGFFRRCGDDNPVADVFYYYYPSNLPDDTVCVVVLTK